MKGVITSVLVDIVIFPCGKIASKLRGKIVFKSRNFFTPKWFTLCNFIAQIFSTWLTFFHVLTTSFLSLQAALLTCQNTPSSSNKFISIQHCYWIRSWTELLDGRERISNFAKITQTHVMASNAIRCPPHAHTHARARTHVCNFSTKGDPNFLTHFTAKGGSSIFEWFNTQHVKCLLECM